MYCKNYLTVCILLASFCAFECCCPYFDSQSFKEKQDRLNNKSACLSTYSDSSYDGSSVPYDGSNVCQIFAVRAYGITKANEVLCTDAQQVENQWSGVPSTSRPPVKEKIDHISCTNLNCGADGKDPENITFSYIIRASRNISTPLMMQKTCIIQIDKVKFSDVLSEFERQCTN